MTKIDEKMNIDILERSTGGKLVHKLPSTNIQAIEDLRVRRGHIEYFDGAKWLQILNKLDLPVVDVESITDLQLGSEGLEYFDGYDWIEVLNKADLPEFNITSMDDLRVRQGLLEFFDGSVWRPIALHKDDKTGSPGPFALHGGNMDAGYFGIVPANELFSNNELTAATGITEGTPLNEGAGWLKFASEGKIKFKSIKSFRAGTSPQHLIDKGVIDGTKTVDKDGIRYKVTLLKGSSVNPAPAREGTDFQGYESAHESEWNKLMLPIHEWSKLQSWSEGTYVKRPIEDWGVYLTGADLGFGHFYQGTFQFCKEQLTVVEGTPRQIARGGGVDASSSGTTALNIKDSTRGWSPVLEVVGYVDELDSPTDVSHE